MSAAAWAPPSLSAAEVAKLVHGTLHGSGDRTLRGLQTVRHAGPDEITFIADDASAAQWTASAGGAALVSKTLVESGRIDADVVTTGRCIIVVDDADQSMIDLLEHFAPPQPQPALGIDAAARVHPTAQLGDGCRIAAFVVVGAGCRIGDAVTLHPGVCLYDDVVVGDGTIIHANTVIRERCTIGRRVVLHQNVSIGADGFGFRPAPDGRGLRKVPQIGTVVIEDDVEIGPGTCVDRAKFGATVVGAGTKIDNLCQIAHNCRIGRACAIAGCVGLAGSVEVGDGVQIGGGCCIADHRRIGDGARVGAMSGVHTDVPPGATFIGLPAGDVGPVLRQYAAIRRLPDWLRQAAKASGRTS